MTRVTKNNDAKRNWKSFKVKTEADVRETPLANAREAIGDHDEVD